MTTSYNPDGTTRRNPPVPRYILITGSTVLDKTYQTYTEAFQALESIRHTQEYKTCPIAIAQVVAKHTVSVMYRNELTDYREGNFV